MATTWPELHAGTTFNHVWDVGTLAWVKATQTVGGGGDASAANQATEITYLNAIAAPVAVDNATGKIVSMLGGGVCAHPTVAAGAAHTLSLTEAGELRTAQSLTSLTPLSGTATSSGNTVLITPQSGLRVRLYYGSYNPVSAVTCGFRFGAAGQLFLLNAAPAGSIIAKDWNALRFVHGAVNEALYINLSAAVSTIWNIFYIETASID